MTRRVAERSWPHRSVRLRSALAAVVALGAVLLVTCVTGVLVQRNDLTDATELVAEDQAQTVAQIVAAGAHQEASLSDSLGGESTQIQVVDRTGHVLKSSPSLHGQDALLDHPADATRVGRRVPSPVDDEADDYLAVAVTVPGTNRYVVAAQSLESVDAAAASTTRLLAVGGALLMLIVGVLGYWLVNRALRPVESMRVRLAEITAADLSARLPTIATGDEIAELSGTLNDMLARLESSADAQRQFVADASHELRSPIATIRTLHEVAIARPGNADWSSVSNDVLSETSRLERLVGDLLLLARSGNSHTSTREEVDLSSLLKDEVKRARNVRIDAHIDNDVHLYGDRNALARAIRNLLDNAERHARSAVRADLTASDDAIIITVADDGPGIAAVDAERVFDRFVRLDEARTRDEGGSGLGLPITRHIAHEHDGTAQVAQSSSGTTLEIRLPRPGNTRQQPRSDGAPTRQSS